MLELRIGYHLLEGAVEKLKKPLAVLEKRAIPRDMDVDEGPGPSACSGQAASHEWQYDAEGLPRVPQPSVEYKARPILLRRPTQGQRRRCYLPLSDRCGTQVIGVVRQKVLFKNRPRALISKPDSNKR